MYSLELHKFILLHSMLKRIGGVVEREAVVGREKV